jgi:hypothetical protein
LSELGPSLDRIRDVRSELVVVVVLLPLLGSEQRVGTACKEGNKKRPHHNPFGHLFMGKSNLSNKAVLESGPSEGVPGKCETGRDSETRERKDERNSEVGY